MKKCVKCGYELSDNSKFCNECGEIQPIPEQYLAEQEPKEFILENNHHKLDVKLLKKCMVSSAIIVLLILGLMVFASYTLN